MREGVKRVEKRALLKLVAEGLVGEVLHPLLVDGDAVHRFIGPEQRVKLFPHFRREGAVERLRHALALVRDNAANGVLQGHVRRRDDLLTLEVVEGFSQQVSRLSRALREVADAIDQSGPREGGQRLARVHQPKLTQTGPIGVGWRALHPAAIDHGMADDPLSL